MVIGEFETSAYRHTKGFNPQKLGDFLEAEAAKYLDRVHVWQAWARKEIHAEQAEATLEAAGMSGKRVKAMMQQFEIEAETRGATVWALYSALTYYSAIIAKPSAFAIRLRLITLRKHWTSGKEKLRGLSAPKLSSVWRLNHGALYSRYIRGGGFVCRPFLCPIHTNLNPKGKTMKKNNVKIKLNEYSVNYELKAFRLLNIMTIAANWLCNELALIDASGVNEPIPFDPYLDDFMEALRRIINGGKQWLIIADTLTAATVAKRQRHGVKAPVFFGRG